MRLQDNSKCYIYTLQESQKEHREKGPEKMSEYIIAKNSLTWERKYSLKSKKAQSSTQDKTKKEYAETHINQTDQN